MPIDVDAFVASLHGRVPAAQLPLYREAAALLTAGAAAAALDDALAEAVAGEVLRGASAQRVSNLRRVADELRAFATAGEAPAAIAGAAPVAPAAAVAVAVAGPAAPGPLEVTYVRAARPVEAASVARAAAALPPPLPGCTCAQRTDTYFDDYSGAVVPVGVGIAIVTWVAVMWGPSWLWLAVAAGLAAIACGLNALAVGWRCEGCRRWVGRASFDADQRATVTSRRIASGVLAGCLALVAYGALTAARHASGL
ncbi:MAG: hypothetical protein R3B06_01650 [Kofleriaceae bacterium]